MAYVSKRQLIYSGNFQRFRLQYLHPQCIKHDRWASSQRPGPITPADAAARRSMALGHSSLPNRHQYVRLTSPHFLPVHPVYQSILCTSLYDRLVRMRHVSTTGWRGQRTAQPVPGVNPALALAKFASAFEPSIDPLLVHPKWPRPGWRSVVWQAFEVLLLARTFLPSLPFASLRFTSHTPAPALSVTCPVDDKDRRVNLSVAKRDFHKGRRPASGF